jgi:hypothetical protein
MILKFSFIISLIVNSMVSVSRHLCRICVTVLATLLLSGLLSGLAYAQDPSAPDGVPAESPPAPTKEALLDVLTPDATAPASIDAATESPVAEAVETVEENAANAEFEAEPAELPAAEAEEIDRNALTLTEQIDLFENDLASFRVDENDVADLYEILRDDLRIRLWQFDMTLRNVILPESPAEIDTALLEERHPGFPRGSYQLPADVITVRDLYANLQELYDARLRVLALATGDVQDQVAGTAMFGLQELRAEVDMVLLEFRYQGHRIPQMLKDMSALAAWAPVALLWLLVQVWIAVALFRWWRRWLPGTLNRLRDGLLAIRPRSEEIMTRLRVLWYVNQIRGPLEWLALFIALYSILDFAQLSFVQDISQIVIRWILLAWFAVVVLNAIAARGSSGMAGESARLRLQSMRLVAAWIVVAALGLELTDYLVGAGALYSWVWRAFQLLAVPLVLRLLDIWHMELYLRLQREGEPEIPEAEYAAQRGWQKWRGSVQVASLLSASWLRSVLLRRMEQFGPAILSSGGEQAADVETLEEHQRLPSETRESLINGYDDYPKYARAERRALVKRIHQGAGGMVVVIGERGIGKRGFLNQVAAGHEHGTITIDCASGDYATVEAEFLQQLGLQSDSVNAAAINSALLEQDIRLVAVHDIHFLARPVMGGFGEISKIAELEAQIDVPLIWAMSLDRYAHQLISRARSAHAKAGTEIQLRAWSEEQIGDIIEQRCAAVGLQPDFSKIRIPRQYMDTAQDAIEERNRAGTYAMISALSRGNPAIAIRLFADCLEIQNDGTAEVTLPENSDAQVFNDSAINILLILRVIAQSEKISFDDIVANLRFEPGLVRTTLHFGLMRGWLEQEDGGYRLSWTWFRTITRVLARQNLLAGVTQEAR